MSITRVALFGLVTLTTPLSGLNGPAAAPAAGQSHQHLALPTNSALVEQVRRATEELADVQEARPLVTRRFSAASLARRRAPWASITSTAIWWVTAPST